jgi:hypothetical protein
MDVRGAADCASDTIKKEAGMTAMKLNPFMITIDI